MNKLFLTIIKPSALTYHDLLLRVFTGATMIYHGQGKWFNLDATAGFFAKFGIEPAYFMAILASMGEMLGGGLLIIGLFTRFGALILSASMVVAIVTIGWPNGFDVRQGGFEYMGTLFVVFIFIMVNGAGKFSLDQLIYKKAHS